MPAAPRRKHPLVCLSLPRLRQPLGVAQAGPERVFVVVGAVPDSRPSFSPSQGEVGTGPSLPLPIRGPFFPEHSWPLKQGPGQVTPSSHLTPVLFLSVCTS